MLHFNSSEISKPKNTKANTIWYMIIQYTVLILILMIIGIYVYGQFFKHAPSYFHPRCVEYRGTWNWDTGLGTTESFVAPGQVSSKIGEAVALYTVLPEEVGADDYLFIRTGLDLIVYIGGDKVFDHKLTQSTLPGENVKGMWLPIKVHPEDAGKTLYLYRSDAHYYNGILSTCYWGNMQGFLKVLLIDNEFILLIAFSLVIFGLIISVASVIYRIYSKKSFPLMYLSVGVLASGFWFILDNFAYPFLFFNYNVDGIVEYLIVMLLPFPFISYLNLVQKRKYQWIYNILNAILLVGFFIFTSLQFSSSMFFYDTMWMMNVLLAIIILVCSGVLFFDVIYKKNRDYLTIFVGFLILILFALIEIVYLNLPVHNNDGIFAAIGLLGILFCAVVHEITNLRQLQEQTLEATESNRAKSTFLANMSHEIRTPINAIMGMNELILRENSSDSIREYSENIRSASQTLLEIINDILDFSKIEQGKMEIIKEDYDIRELLLSVISMIKVKADEKGLRLNLEIDPDMPKVLRGDSKRIREIMINLLNNAVKYTHKGSVTLAVTVKEDENDGACLEISVRDTGIGIRDEDRNKLFLQFERLDFVRNKSIEGSGLGLAITGNLVSLMGGNIECNSAYGVGSEFIVTIPQSIIDPDPMGNLEDYHPDDYSEEAASDASFVCPSANILIVDDNDMNLKVAAGLIETTKAKVTSCYSGYEMLKLIVKHKYDIILLDHMMPDMDGIETLSAAKNLTGNLNTETPVIALTANAIVGAREMYLNNGFTDYLSKPMDVKHLSSMLKSYLPADKIIYIHESELEHQKRHNAYNSSVIDKATGLRYCGDLEDFYHDALKLYAESLPEKIASIEEMYNKKDFANYEVLVHSLKSNSMTIGATDLSAMAKDLEFACKEKNYSFVDKNHKRLLEMCGVVAEEASKMLK